MEQHEAKQKKVDKIKENIRLKAKGFVKDETLGFLFPGVDPEKYRLQREKNGGQADSLVPPKMKVGAISGEGTIKIEFDQEMMAPNEIDPKMYSQVFEF